MVFLLAPASAEPNPLTLDEALRRALDESPRLALQGADVASAEAELRRSRTYPYNPELELSLGDRDGAFETSTDRSFGLAQEIEIAGQGRRRRAVAMSALEAAQKTWQREETELVADVRLAFAEAVRSRESLAVAESDARLAERLLQLSKRRLEAGAGTQVELNFAHSAAGRAVGLLRSTEAEDTAARSRLGELIGMSSGSTVPGVTGELPFPDASMPQLDKLLTLAGEGRSDLAASRETGNAARLRIALLRREAVPNLRLQLSFEDEGDEEIRAVGLSVPIPLFQRKQGEIASARAELDRSRASTEVLERRVRREVEEALADYRAARQTVLSLRDLVVGSFENSLELLEKSLEAGKISGTEVLVFRRELVESRRQYIDALFAAEASRIRLWVATGGSLAQGEVSSGTTPSETVPSETVSSETVARKNEEVRS